MGYETLYSVSNTGLIRRDARGRGTFTGRLLRFGICRGYYQTFLYINGVKKTLKVHKVVAAAFLGPVPYGAQVNHKDGVKANNRPENLEYVSAKENLIHAVRNGLCHHPRGEAHIASKLTDSKVREIRRLLASGVSKASLSRTFQVSRAVIHDVSRGRTWKHVTISDSPHNADTVDQYLNASQLSPVVEAEYDASSSKIPYHPTSENHT